MVLDSECHCRFYPSLIEVIEVIETSSSPRHSTVDFSEEEMHSVVNG